MDRGHDLCRSKTNCSVRPQHEPGNGAVTGLAIVKYKVEIRKFAEGLRSAGKIKWTNVIPWAWLFGWKVPNPKIKTIRFHDSGETIVCTSTMERIAEDAVKALTAEHADSTKN
jgi:hypothetical protein